LLPLRFLGQISFEMYLFHMVVFRLVEKAGLLSLTANNYINYWLVYVSVVTGAVLISLVWKKAMGLLLR
jgi:peptidoglycan/LPS O-acetylase OafA/YrhL